MVNVIGKATYILTNECIEAQTFFIDLVFIAIFKTKNCGFLAFFLQSYYLTPVTL